MDATARLTKRRKVDHEALDRAYLVTRIAKLKAEAEREARFAAAIGYDEAARVLEEAAETLRVELPPVTPGA